MASIIMSRSSFLLISLYLFCIALPLTLQQENPLLHFCINDRGNFTTNSTFSSNLGRLSSALSSAAPSPGGFYNFSIGELNSISLCRGDVSAVPCRRCITNATAELRRRCPNQKEAVIWYDSCMVRYSNRSIYASQEIRPRFRMRNRNNVTGTSVQNFNQVLSDLLDRLRTRAAGGGSTRKFATERSAAFNFLSIYALVQCTPDLSELQCSSCLSQNFGQIPSCCDGRVGGRVVGPSCNFRYEAYPFYNASAYAPSSNSQPPTGDAAPPPLNGTTGDIGGQGNEGSSLRKVLAISIPTAAIILILVLSTSCWFFIRKNSKRKYEVVNQANAGDQISTVESIQFELSTILAATNNFSDANKIGEGGFGAVYQGTLPNGQAIAVKRLSEGSDQGGQEFKNEVEVVVKLQHRNLVRLLGFCLHGRENILIYEYVPNKSLNYFLFDPEKQMQVDWPMRIKIIEGVARGLLYLHEDSRLRIIHRDLKASNVLLDENMNAKISDFGMARIFGVDQTQENTNRIVGTFGYMPPEYALHGQYSVKTDVFSFGVLILEIISSKKNTSSFHSETYEGLLSYAWRKWREGSAVEVVHPGLSHSCPGNEVTRCIHVALLCVQEDPTERPTMAAVVLMLSSSSVTLSLPKRPAFFAYSRTEPDLPAIASESDRSASRSGSSVNEASITEPYPR